MKQKYSNVCIKCGSTNLKSGILLSPVELARIVVKAPKRDFSYLCKDCGYYGICPEVDITQIKEFKERIKKYSK